MASSFEEGGSLRPDGSVRRVRRVRASFREHSGRYVPPHASGDDDSSRSQRRRNLSSLVPELPELPAIEIRNAVEVPFAEAIRREAKTFVLPSSYESEALAWLPENVELVFRGRDRSQRAALYATLEDHDLLRGESRGLGADRAVYVTRGVKAKKKKARLLRGQDDDDDDVAALWRFVQFERTSGDSFNRDVSRGELDELLRSDAPPEWVSELRRRLCAATVSRCAIVDAVVRGDVATVGRLAESDRSLLFESFSQGDPPLLHVAIRHGQLAVVRLLIEGFGLKPRLTFDRQSGYSALDLAQLLPAGDIVAFLQQST